MNPLALLFVRSAAAFCGTYVGSADSELSNHSSHVILARDGSETVLTVSMDYDGDASQFALLLPVPEILRREDVSTPDRELVDAVESYGAARAVEYSCEDALPVQVGVGCGGLLGCASAEGAYADTAWRSTVDVVASFDVAGYNLVVLSAEQSDGLWTWLDQNGYAVPEGGEDVLQEYIDAGAYFLAVKIDLTEVETVQGWLPPLQFRYSADVFGLPIRIGTISAEGEQEVVINVIADEELGQAGISNYPEYELDHDCMVDWGDDFGAWYEARIDGAFAQGAGWLREHSWPVFKRVETMGTYHCDPCTMTITETGDFEAEQLAALGAGGDELHLSRLRVRYRPEEATEDLVFYFDGIRDQKGQSRFIAHRHELESLYPVCDSGWAADPGTCPAPASSSWLFAPLGLLLGGGWIARRRG